MYPGIYQPLQAVSLVLADLLRQPHSDNASMSQGLIDTIFELYQVDEGIVTKRDPPSRRLSPSGRDAWMMLVSTRRKALEQIGADHHVLMPSAVVSSNSCICGERISGSNESDQGRQQPPSREYLSPMYQHVPVPRYEMNEGRSGLTPETPSLGNVKFDWCEWDQALGLSVGLML